MDDVAKHALLMWEPKMCRLAWQLLSLLGNSQRSKHALQRPKHALQKYVYIYIYIYYIVELLHGCHNLRLVYTFLNDLNTTIIHTHTQKKKKKKNRHCVCSEGYAVRFFLTPYGQVKVIQI